MATTGWSRNYETSQTPSLMENHAGTYQYGVALRESDRGVTLFRRDLSADPLLAGSYDTFDLSSDSTASTALALPISATDDGHYKLGIGVDEQERIHLYGNGHAESLRYCRIAWSPPSAPVVTVPSYAFSGTGANSHTYCHFARTSDGTLLLFFDQQDNVSDSRGRDWLGYYLPPGTGTTWLPILSGSGEFATSLNGAAGTGNRVYLGGVVVDPDDNIHVWGNYRTNDADADSATAAFYMKAAAADLPSTSAWKSVTGTTLSMPLTWANRTNALITSAPSWFRGAGCGVGLTDGYPSIILSNGNSVGAGLIPGLSTFIRCYHNPSTAAWEVTSLTAIGNSAGPSIVSLRGEAFTVGVSPAGRIRLRNSAGGAVGATSFLLGSVIPTHTEPYPDPVAMMRGRLDFLVLDGDDPRVYSFGNHRRFNAA